MLKTISGGKKQRHFKKKLKNNIKSSIQASRIVFVVVVAKMGLESDFSHQRSPGNVALSNNGKLFMMKRVLSLDFA